MNTDEFFDTTEIDEIDRLIAEDIAKPALTDQLQEQNDKQIARKMHWVSELTDFWFVYVFLGISALFTGMLGFYLGTTPHLEPGPNGTQMIVYDMDIGHMLTAIGYIIAFIAVTEGAFIVGKLKFHQREQTNPHQAWTMILVMFLAFVSIIGTGIAGGNVIASTLQFLSEFVEVSPSAQKWVIRVIPILLGLYAVLYTIYVLSSRQAKNERITRDQKKKRELDHRTRMDNIELIGERAFQLAEIKLYKKAVLSGALTAAEANAARRAGKTLQQLERELGRDLDGNNDIGTVGNPSRNNHREPQPGYASETEDFTRPSDRS